MKTISIFLDGKPIILSLLIEKSIQIIFTSNINILA